MAKRSRTEEKLKMLKELEEAPVTREASKELRKALGGANNILAARAAKIVGNRWVEDLTPDLLKAFERFMKNPLKSDAGCLAKEAIVEALDQLEYGEEDIFLRGVKYFQLEPAYLRSVDSAAILRGKCAFALLRLGYPHIVFVLVDLLSDPEPPARIAAVNSLAHISGEVSEPLLRLKASLGDEDHQVIAECLSALAQIHPGRAMNFLEKFLTSRDPVLAENAAFALGETRREEAFEILRKHGEENMNPDFQDMLLMPIAVTRLEEAFEYLMDVIETGGRASAVAAVKAAKIYGDDRHLSRIHEAVTSRDDEKATEAFAAWRRELDS
ncbi:MAG: hypothetical protein GY859_34670 [Desulfobacterales bacterium]|nr:hypothetical protein [Desulfobacterales bacterium]